MIARSPHLQVTGGGRHRGFTLMEVVVVILIVMVVAAASMPTLFRMGRSARIKAAARKVGAFFQGVRHRAIMDGTFVHLRWTNTAEGGYIEACTSRNASPPGNETTEWGEIVQMLPAYSMAQGITLPSAFRFNPAQGVLTFYPDGSVPTTTLTTLRVENAADPQNYMEIVVYAGSGIVEMKGPPHE